MKYTEYSDHQFEHIEKSIQDFIISINQVLDSVLPKAALNDLDVLQVAMRYMVLPENHMSSMRIRPYLLTRLISMLRNQNVADCEDNKDIMIIAAAIELIHNYSLIHDDLPDLDNDDYRRGVLSCHKKFGNANAILAGDALLTEAFHILSSDRFQFLDPVLRIKIINTIAYHSGINGMVYGQAIDMLYKDKEIESAEDRQLLLRKTTGLFQMICEVACIICRIDKKNTAYLSDYGVLFGTLYQVIDDIADNHGDQITNVALSESIIQKMGNILNSFDDSVYKNELILLPYYIQYLNKQRNIK